MNRACGILHVPRCLFMAALRANLPSIGDAWPLLILLLRFRHGAACAFICGTGLADGGDRAAFYCSDHMGMVYIMTWASISVADATPRRGCPGEAGGRWRASGDSAVIMLASAAGAVHPHAGHAELGGNICWCVLAAKKKRERLVTRRG